MPLPHIAVSTVSGHRRLNVGSGGPADEVALNHALIVPGDAAPTPVHTLSTGTAKFACDVAATTNVTLSGLPTLDGVALAAGARVLAAGQTDSTANGIYVAAAGAWARAPDALKYGLLVPVLGGATAGGRAFLLTGGVAGADAAAMTWVAIPPLPVVVALGGSFITGSFGRFQQYGFHNAVDSTYPLSGHIFADASDGRIDILETGYYAISITVDAGARSNNVEAIVEFRVRSLSDFQPVTGRYYYTVAPVSLPNEARTFSDIVLCAAGKSYYVATDSIFPNLIVSRFEVVKVA